MSYAIETVNLTHYYSKGTVQQVAAINDVNLQIEKGELVGIIGHTGSGKSTLISHFNGLLKPDSGKVLVDGEDIWKYKETLRQSRFKVGLCFQYPEYQLFEETVYKDIAFGPKNMKLSDEEIKKRVKLAAEFCGLSEKELKRSPFELSGGQKRRAAIAGVLAMRPEVLVLDEPAAGLDPKGKEEILSGLVEYKNTYGATLLIISHSMEDIAKYADEILVMKDGEIYMHGGVEEIFMQAEKLFDARLDLPQITKLFIELKKRDLVNSTDVYSVGYAKKEIEKLINAR